MRGEEKKAISLSGEDAGWLLSLQGISKSWEKEFQQRPEVPTHRSSSPVRQKLFPQTPQARRKGPSQPSARKMHTPALLSLESLAATSQAVDLVPRQKSLPSPLSMAKCYCLTPAHAPACSQTCSLSF